MFLHALFFRFYHIKDYYVQCKMCCQHSVGDEVDNHIVLIPVSHQRNNLTQKTANSYKNNSL